MAAVLTWSLLVVKLAFHNGGTVVVLYSLLFCVLFNSMDVLASRITNPNCDRRQEANFKVNFNSTQVTKVTIKKNIEGN